MKLASERLITLSPSGKQFTALTHGSLLEAGLGHGIALPYRCSNGSCGECRAIVKTGEVETFRFHDYVISESEKGSGTVLLCCSQAITDVEIEVIEATDPQDIPLQQLNTRVCDIEELPDTLIVRLKITRGKVLRFLAGQYATLHVPDHDPVLLPIASCPCETGYLEFHIPASLTQLCQRAKTLRRSHRVAVTGPYGSFTLANSTLKDRQQVFITTDHGFGVIKPLIEHIIATELEPDCSFYWITKDPYKNNLCRSWLDAFDWFSYHPITEIDHLSHKLNSCLSLANAPASVYLSVEDEYRQRIAELLPQNELLQLHTDELAKDSATVFFAEQPER